MMNEDELKEAMKQHMIKEYKDWLHELKINRMRIENLVVTADGFKQNLRNIHTTAYELFGADFANSLVELDELGELDKLDKLDQLRKEIGKEE